VALLAVLELDFLHRGDELIGFVVVDGLLLEEFIVQSLAAAQEKRHPRTIKQATRKENSKDQFVVEKQHYRKYHESEHSESHAQCLAGEEVVHAAMVVHPLHKVAHELGVKERHGQFQQFDEEIAHQRYIHTHGNVQQKPAADEVGDRAAKGEHQLPEQYQPNEADILVLDAHVNDRLSEKWQDELQQTAHYHAQYNLHEIASVLSHIAK